MTDRTGNLLDRLIERLDVMDSNSVQAYILHLYREKGFLETIFNAVREGILVIDRRLRIKYHNQAAREILGLPEDLNKVRISQFLRDVDWRRILQEDEVKWDRITRQEVEIIYPRRRIVQFYLVPHGNDDKNNGIATVILNDVTESRRRTLDEIETEKSSLVSMLAAGVAHEIGNPLNSLYLHLQLLQRELAGKNFKKKEAAELVDTAKSEVERLDTIIHQFLHAIRPGRPEMRMLDLKEVIVETLTFMRREIEDRGIAVKCSWPEVLPPVNGDANQLKQAFYNILKNALQAMPHGGSIEIECSFDAELVTLSFADSGSGIRAEDINQVFEPFRTTKKEGSGLGLMIVERIIREHGAELAVESEVGRGTKFIIRFSRNGRRFRLLPEVHQDDLLVEAKKSPEEKS